MLSERANQIEPFIVMEVLERAQELVRQGKQFIENIRIGLSRLEKYISDL